MVIFKLMKTFHTPYTLSHPIPVQSSTEGLVFTPVQRRKLRLSGPTPSSRTLANWRLRFYISFFLANSNRCYFKHSKDPINNSKCVMSSYQRWDCSFCWKFHLPNTSEPADLSSLSLNKHSKASANIWKHLLCARKGPKVLHTLCHSLTPASWEVILLLSYPFYGCGQLAQNLDPMPLTQH